jgi:hypothetical protein
MGENGSQPEQDRSGKPKSGTAYGGWCDFLRRHKFGKPDQADLQPVAQRLKQLPYLQALSKAQDIEDSVALLAQGQALLGSALHDPLKYHAAAGDKLTVTRKARMAQWRLVMAFSGFETLSKGLILPRGREWKNPRFGEYIRRMDIAMSNGKATTLQPLSAPALDNQTRKRFFEDIHLQPGGAFARLLNLNEHDIQLMGNWISGKTHLESWDERLRLAKASRNCTVHGALSATKTADFGFVPAFKEMTTNIATFAESVFKHLTNQTRQ